MAWKVDPSRSRIGFSVRHLMITRTRGRFGSFEGTLHMDEENPQASSAEGTVDVATIKTGIFLRDNNLRSRDRLDAKGHPKMTFRSTEIGPFEGDRFKVYGELTIKGITRPVVFDIVNRGELPAEEGKRRWRFDATILVNRLDFDIKWHPLLEIAESFVANEITGELQMEFVQG